MKLVVEIGGLKETNGFYIDFLNVETGRDSRSSLSSQPSLHYLPHLQLKVGLSKNRVIDIKEGLVL